jgi:pimeloyl-ACP methyl ester carboxylesterase
MINMKILPTILLLFLLVNNLCAQNTKKGKVFVEKFLAASLQGNFAEEDAMRRMTIYLPPDYEATNKRYPVIYFLHGFLENDSLSMARLRFDTLIDRAILNGHMRSVILVLPNSDNTFGGGLYTNSSLTGNWADFIAKDVVNYVDKKFRTISDKRSRGLAGISGGGYGVLKIGMIYPDVFSAVHAISPGLLGWGGEFTIHNPFFKGLDSFKNEFTSRQINESLEKGDPEFFKKFYTKLLADLARTYSPNQDTRPLSADLPVTYLGDSMIINQKVKKLWEDNFPINMIEGHLPALKSLNALKIEWGRNDEIPHIPVTCLQFSKKLEANKVKHFAEEFLGGHGDKVAGLDGIIYTEMLPFFDAYLDFRKRHTAPK